MNPKISDLERSQITHTQAVLKSAAYLLPFFVLGFLVSIGFAWLHAQCSYILLLCIPISLAGIYLVWRCVLDVYLWQAVLASGSLNDLDACLLVFFKRSLKGVLLEKRLMANRRLFRQLLIFVLLQICLMLGLIVWISIL